MSHAAATHAGTAGINSESTTSPGGPYPWILTMKRL